MIKQLIFIVAENVEIPKYTSEEFMILKVCNEEKRKVYLENAISDKNTIYVCDEEKIARVLYENGKNVVALLTEENRGQNFSYCSYAITDAKECESEFFEMLFRRFSGLPLYILETNRCIVRESTIEDVDSFYELYKDKEITEFMEPLFEDKNEEIEYVKAYIKNVYEFYGFGIWTIVEKESGKIIGRAGVSYREGYDIAEMGFMIGKRYQRKGYAYEVCTAICDYMYHTFEMDKIQMFIEPQNTPSIHLAKKLGARLYQKECMGKWDGYLMKLPLS